MFGALGAVIGMKVFKHKISKPGFKILIPLFIILHAILVVYFSVLYFHWFHVEYRSPVKRSSLFKWIFFLWSVWINHILIIPWDRCRVLLKYAAFRECFITSPVSVFQNDKQRILCLIFWNHLTEQIIYLFHIENASFRTLYRIYRPYNVTWRYMAFFFCFGCCRRRCFEGCSGAEWGAVGKYGVKCCFVGRIW